MNYELIEEDWKEIKDKLLHDYTTHAKVKFVESFLRKHDILRNTVTHIECPHCNKKLIVIKK